jgi:hypothetical protein
MMLSKVGEGSSEPFPGTGEQRVQLQCPFEVTHSFAGPTKVRQSHRALMVRLRICRVGLYRSRQESDRPVMIAIIRTVDGFLNQVCCIVYHP